MKKSQMQIETVNRLKFYINQMTGCGVIESLEFSKDEYLNKALAITALLGDFGIKNHVEIRDCLIDARYKKLTQTQIFTVYSEQVTIKGENNNNLR